MSSPCVVSESHLGRWSIYPAAKRLGDLIVASGLLIVLSPLMVGIALICRKTSPGPALFRQRRVGINDRLFTIYKFRTMFVESESRGPLITSADDPRITPLGRILRNLKLDELPQLLNVVKGDMSLVGPRPQVALFVDALPQERRRVVVSVRPGMTGPAQIQFRNEETLLDGRADREAYYIEELLLDKCDMDIEYVLHRSMRYDVALICTTGFLLVPGIFRRLLCRAAKPVLEVAPGSLIEQYRD